MLVGFLILEGISAGELIFVFLIVLLFFDLKVFLKWQEHLEEE